MQSATPKHIIVYDGVCKFCNSSVNFILSKDTQAKYRFCAAQSDLGAQLMLAAGFEDTGNALSDYESLLLVRNWGAEKVLIEQKSDAFFSIMSNLGYPYKAVLFFKVIPRFMRNRVYDVIARNRYRWFGKHAVCQLPNPDFKNRFID